jgi:hypothetical protein
MTIDYKANPAHAKRFSTFDAETGECLDRERIFYADDEAGLYRRHIANEAGQGYVWDSRDNRRLTGTFGDPRNPVPDECREVAWEEVRRAIVIRPRGAVA